MKFFAYILFTLLLFQLHTLGQQVNASKVSQEDVEVSSVSRKSSFKDTTLYNWVEITSDSLAYYSSHVIVIERSACKGYRAFYLAESKMQLVKVESLPFAKKVAAPILSLEHHPLLTIHGNVMYDMNYRSNIDTPYAEKNIYLHTLQTWLDITYKDHYPVKVSFTTRFGNSSLFKNFSDINLQFNPGGFSTGIKKQLLGIVQQRSIRADSLAALKKLLDQKTIEYLALKTRLLNPSRLQKLVEEKEQQFNQMKGGSIEKNLAINGKGLADSSIHSSLQTQHQLDSLQAELTRLEKIYRQAGQLQNNTSQQAKREIEEITNTKQLKDKLSQLQIADSVLPHGYKTLFAIKTMDVGRCIADYSELSVKNVSITGLQVEYNPSYYLAFAAGFVDYRFRDYILPSTQTQKQWLALIRVGSGEKEGNHTYLTYYSGKRQLYNASTTSTGSAIPDYNLLGFTIEKRYNLSRNSYIIGEVAKSSLPYYSTDSSKGPNRLENMVNVNDRSNEAYSVKLGYFIPATQTILSGVYRHIGANFQSFSLFTTGASQSSWSAKVEQPFFQRRLNIIASIKDNDFTNPFINSNYHSTSLLKSIQATLRMKKWPVLTLGYYPSSQVTKLSDTQYSENLFYTLAASASHFYRVHRVQFNTMLLYTQFYNRSTDSGFVYFNTRNLQLIQSAFLGRFNLQFSFSSSANTDYCLYVLEQTLQYRVAQWLTLGGGLKYNKQTVYNLEQWGYSSNATLKIPKVGDLQLLIDKGFVPGANKQLVKNDIGRITYLRNF